MPPPTLSEPGFEAPRDLASLFLGPKAENAEFLERLLLEALRDHVFWRRNFHPEDGRVVREAEKRRPAYERSLSDLSQALMELLAELKGGVPFFSPRYVGHMASDLTMASLVGYFATMLYNPNNVSAESSPVTTRLELEVAAQLSAMVGHPPATQWGHLTSGGTVANFEALWIARNLKYLPLAIRWAAKEAGQRALPVELAGGERAELAGIGLWELLNVAPVAALDLLERFRAALGPREAGTLLGRHALAGLGYQEFGRRLFAEFGDAFPPAVVLVPSTAHYSWEKTCRALGIGTSQLVHVPVDARFRMDPGALEEQLARLASKRQAVVACVGVVGTTEESAVDRLDLLCEVRSRVAREHGLAFHLHADAAFGGYAAAITRNPDGSRRAFAELEGEWPTEEVFRALCALEQTDSVTMDPHKLGFVPYPAGAICFRDRRVRELVSVEAPYVFSEDAAPSASIGRYILEGSKPGAAAASVWLSHRVLPLDSEGYGRLIAATADGARALHAALLAADVGPHLLVPLPLPDLNIVCFAVGHPALGSLEETNALADRLYRALSIPDEPARARPPYLVSRTILREQEYGHAAGPLLAALGFGAEDLRRVGGLTVIRCTLMNPFLLRDTGRASHVQGFVTEIARLLREWAPGGVEAR